VSIDEPYNAFRNPILNRRLRNSISPTTAWNLNLMLCVRVI
jgi:hypothetical protein